MTPLEKHIHEVCKNVVDQHKTTDKLSIDDMADLPVGVVRQIGNGTYVVAIDSAFWNGHGWFFSAYASVQFPGTTHPIAFRAQHVAFTPNGLAGLSQTKLLLASTQWINISEGVVLELPAGGAGQASPNYIDFDCAGFKSINLKGNFHFTRGMLEPAQPDAKDVTASFEANTSDLNNVLASITISPFRIHGLDGLSFEVQEAAVDYSDFANPAGFTFPAGYQQAMGNAPNLWRGFYLKDLKITMDAFTEKGQKPRTFDAQNLLIDDAGVSGTITAANILALPSATAASGASAGTGSVDGWPISITTISIKLLRNSLNGGGLGGELVVPFLGDKPLAYTASMEQVQQHINYKVSVATTADKEFSAPFSARIKLAAGCTVAIERKDGSYVPSAVLNGMMTVGDDKMKASGLKFQNLGLTSRAPYILSGDFSTVGDSQSSTGGFPIRLDSITMRVASGQVAIGFGAALNFMNAEDKGFSARTHITINAKHVETIGSDSVKHQSWAYAGTKVNDIQLNATTTAFTINGRLTIFDNDPKYGNGYRGSLKFAVKKVLERGIQVNAYFGSKDDYRYWHFDAYVPTVAIPIVPPLAITGFIGGASYKMSRSAAFKPDFTKLSDKGTPGNTETNKGSEFEFVPDGKAGLSFMAGVTLIAGSEKAFNSDAVLELAFNTSGGLRYAQFKGSGYFITSVNSRARSTSGTQRVPAPVYADLNAIYDQENAVFHASLATYMNLENIVRGTGPNDMIGEAIIHVDAHDYYIYIGRPSQMMGVDMAGLAVGQGYFMAGTKLEDLPPPPKQVQDIIGDRDMALVRDENTAAMGLGFATGARINVGFDSKGKITPFYVMLDIGGGFDVMIRDYGNATCAGRSGTIGFGGWYASGQAYVFMAGQVGIQVGGHRFNFLSLGAAALLQAKLPNPTWLKGQLSGKYSIMCGLISGHFNVKLVIGEECEIVTPGSELGNVVVIADVSPAAGSNDVSVFSAPQVSFNTPIDTEMSMLNNQDEVNTYRIRLDEFSVTNAGQPVQATREWNARKDVLVLHTAEILPPSAPLRAFAKIHWEKKQPNGSWQPLMANNAVEYETKEALFNTGVAPDFIPDENVVYAYPVKNQYNFLPKEYNKGYVKLRVGQSYLFPAATNGTPLAYTARFEQPSGAKIDVPISYNSAEAQVNFDMPATLAAQTVYKFNFMRVPRSSGEVDSNVTRSTVSMNGGESGNEVNVASNSLEGSLTQGIEKSIYNSGFRTSKFNTFNEKWSALTAPQDLFDVAVGNVVLIGKEFMSQESFDDFEIKGFENHHKELVHVSAGAEASWLQQKIGPMLYDAYPVDAAVTITHRDADSLGLKPLGAVRLYNVQGSYVLNDNNITSGTAVAQSGPVKFLYYLSFISFRDFDELRNKGAAVLISGKPVAPGVTKLMGYTGYVDLLPGGYPVNVSYVLPGVNRVTTEKRINIQF